MRSLLFPVLALGWILPALGLECYSHNGVAASQSEFYNATRDGELVGCGTGITTCCFSKTQYCDVDLLCHDRDTKALSRQYCSDPSWPTDRCSGVCADYAAAGVALTSCNNAGTELCCGAGAQDCCSAGNYTKINSKGIIVAIGTSTLPISSSTPPTGTPTGSSTATDASATADSTPTGSTGESHSGMSETSKLGVGLGVGLGVPFLLVCAGALFLWKRSQNNHAASSPVSPSEQKGPIPVQGSPAEYYVPVQQMDDSVPRGELAGNNRPVHELQ